MRAIWSNGNFAITHSPKYHQINRHRSDIWYIFAQARFYDSTQGRMLGKDPIKRGLNPYPYCDNDPVDYTDPTGEIPSIVVSALIVPILPVP